MVRVVRPWHRLPREAVDVPSLAVFKARWDGALSSLGWWKGSLPMAGGWSAGICKVPSNPNHAIILTPSALDRSWVFTNACSCDLTLSVFFCCRDD